MEIRYRALESWGGGKKKIKQNEKIKPRLISPVSDPLRKKWLEMYDLACFGNFHWKILTKNGNENIYTYITYILEFNEILKRNKFWNNKTSDSLSIMRMNY